MKDTCSTIFSAALRLAAKGMHVFPVHGILEGDGKYFCDCGMPKCSSPGKHPIQIGGFNTATREKTTITAWWERWPNANVGIATGPSGLAVIDVDPRHGGDDAFAGLSERFGSFETAAVVTGSGGSHYYFRAPDSVTIKSTSASFADAKGEKLEGVDVRAAGGYVVAPPSRHISGDTYQWDAGSPDALAEIPAAWLDALVSAQKAPAPQLADAEQIPSGNRNDTLTSIAGTMRRRGMDAEEILAALQAVNKKRCEPPLDDRELRRIANSIGNCPSVQSLGGAGTSSDASLNMVEWGSVRIEPVLWLEENRIPFGELTILEGPGGVGKSTAMLDLAARLSRGAQMPSGTNVQPSDSVIVAVEDRISTIKARLVAAGADLARIHCVASVGDDARTLSFPLDADKIAATVRKYGARLVILDALFNHADPKLNMHRAQDVRQMLGPIVELAHATGAAIIGIRHFRKGAAGADERGLGSVDIRNVARSVLTVGPHPEDDGAYAVAVSKTNLGSPCDALVYRIVSAAVPDEVTGQTVEVGRIEWTGTAPISADRLTMRQPQSEDDECKTDAAGDWLSARLAAGPVAAEVVYAEGQSSERKFSAATLRRAAVRIDAEKVREGFPARSSWRLKTADCSQSAQTAQVLEGEQTEQSVSRLQSEDPAIRAFAGLTLGSKKCGACHRLDRCYTTEAGLICRECAAKASAA